jgi:hypothetical protein
MAPEAVPPAPQSEQSAADPSATHVPLPRIRRSLRTFGRTGEAASGDLVAVPPPRRPAPPVASQQAPALPPPVDIRPAPSPRAVAAPPSAPRPNNGANMRLAPPATVPPPARPRSLFDLFGAAR